MKQSLEHEAKHSENEQNCVVCKKKIMIMKIMTMFNPINPGLLALELTLGGGVFHPPSITPLSLKLDCSNFAQSYFQIG